MTTRLMEHFGQPPVERRSAEVFALTNSRRYVLAGGRYAIEPDATAASYFLALPLAVGGRLVLPGVRSPNDGLQGDARFLEVLRAAGAEIDETSRGLEANVADGGARHGVARDFSEFSDTFLTLAALAPLLDGPTHITGIAHTRKQETDRVAGMARELRQLGQEVVEEDGALTITPRPLRAGVEIETYGDHRFAMSFGILGCHDLHGDGRPWLSIRNPACCAKTFPHFFELLETVRQNSVGR
jgi:3-phosphoshikimate 1-carboxyvinyltransferase